MAKLTGAKKKQFLERMAKGRKKAARGNPKRKTARKPAKKKTVKKSTKASRKRPRNRNAKRNGNGYVVWPSGRPFSLLSKAKAFANELAREGERDVYVENVDTEKTVYRPATRNPKARKASKGTRAKTRTPRGRNPKRRRNNEGEAEQMFQTFHGKAPGRIVEYDELVKFPHHFAEMGRLVELRIDLDRANRKFPFTSFGDCKVVCTPDGQNIYFVGGDQKINLADLDIGGEKDFIELGPCVYICYHTTKDFHDFAPIDYFHEFGEEDGIRPMLAYDRLNQKLFLMGGNYHVKREGIVN